MKLEKREITLNELDSVKDVFYMEKTLLRAYESGEGYAFRKETVNELEKLAVEAKKEAEQMLSLWKKIEKESV